MQRMCAPRSCLPGLVLTLAIMGSCGQNEGGRCQINSDCGSGLICMDGQSGNGVCKPASTPATGTNDAAMSSDAAMSADVAPDLPADAAPDSWAGAGPEAPDLASAGADAAVDLISGGEDAPEDQASGVDPDAAPAAFDATGPDAEPNPVPVDGGAVDVGGIDADGVDAGATG